MNLKRHQNSVLMEACKYLIPPSLGRKNNLNICKTEVVINILNPKLGFTKQSHNFGFTHSHIVLCSLSAGGI